MKLAKAAKIIEIQMAESWLMKYEAAGLAIWQSMRK